MKSKIIMTIFAGATLISCTNKHTISDEHHLVIERQGSFTVGGQQIKREGIYDGKTFTGFFTPNEAGQTMHVDHAYVDYQIPVNARSHSIIYVHGYGGSGMTWTSTPDGREGFATLMLRKGYPSYVMDLPGRRRAGKTSAETTVKPQANEQFWFDIWRIGEWPNYNEGVQFSMDSAAFSQFFRAMTPNIGTGNPVNDVATIDLLAGRIGANILVTHSAGGLPGWLAAVNSDQIKAVVAYEPGAYLFPEGEVPEPIEGLTGGTRGVPVSVDDFKKLVKKPIVIYFGDYIPEEVTHQLGGENWRVRLQMGRKFVEAVNRHGGKATLVELPKIGIKGNTHFLMSDLNNNDLVDLLVRWFEENGLN